MNNLELLRERSKQLASKQAICNHDWDNEHAIYEPKDKEVMITDSCADGSYTLRAERGTGAFSAVDCWVITCKKCGLKKESYKKPDTEKSQNLQDGIMMKKLLK